MKTIAVTREELEKLRRLHGGADLGSLAFSTNYKGEIWPRVRLGNTPENEREEFRGRFKLVDQVAHEYLKVRSVGGRFRIQEDGAWYEEEGYAPVQFLKFQVSDPKLKGDSSMERIYNCISCTKPFKVMNEAPRSSLSDVPDVPTSVECPVCNTSNQITWPQGTRFIVVPEN
jgi:hypothetical protein